MYITLSIAFIITVVITFAAFYRQKSKEADDLRTQLYEQRKTHDVNDAEKYERLQAEKKRRDLVEIYLVTDNSPEDCEKIYTSLCESGNYCAFFEAKTKAEKLHVLQQKNEA